jgi:hypothetical protein
MAPEDKALTHDDGLAAPDVGPWAEEKHRMVSLYSTLFSSGMKAKWSRRIYVELYAGAGHSRIRGTSKFILGSPLLALKLKDPFDKYVFCEEKPTHLRALKVRARQISPMQTLPMYRAIATGGPRRSWRKFREDQRKTLYCRFALLIHLTSAWSLKRYVLSQTLALLISWYCSPWEWMQTAITNTISGRTLTKLTSF